MPNHTALKEDVYVTLRKNARYNIVAEVVNNLVKTLNTLETQLSEAAEAEQSTKESESKGNGKGKSKGKSK